MPTLPPSSTTRESTLSLLRSLLRETSYLADPSSRLYFQSYILSRFRQNITKRPPEPTKSLDRRPSRPPNRNKQNTETALKGLSVLRRANQGELKALEKVLMHTYGRSGKRRHELLAPLLEPDTPSNAAILSEKAAQNNNNKTLDPSSDKNAHKPAHPSPSQKLLALMKSQAQTSIPELTRLKLKSTKPTLPEKDIWARPLAWKREKNIRRRWWAHMLERILPPLPSSEFSRLRDLVTGRRRFGFKERRERARDVRRWGQDEDGGWCIELLEDGDLDVCDDEEEEKLEISAELQRLICGDSVGKTHPSRNRKEQPHIITKRLMRRLWGKVLSQCPVMNWDMEKERWRVEWGDVDRAMAEIRGPVVGVGRRGWFEGVDEKGRIEKTEGKDITSVDFSRLGLERRGLKEVEMGLRRLTTY